LRGDGSIYLRGRTWWATYYANGERQRESLKTEDEDLARKKLRKLLRGVVAGEVPTVAQRRATVGDLLDDLLLNMSNRAVASVDKVTSHLKAVRAELEDVPAAKLETAQVEACQAQWLEEGAKPATVNRRCEALRQAFRLAYNRTPRKVHHVPLIPLLPVENARQGFLSRADFEALLLHLPDLDVRDFVEWFWWTGMRPKEIRQLTWDMLDRETWTLHLAAEATKGRKGNAAAG
jgi:integrase